MPLAFDEAVKGVGGVFHTASPFILDVKDNEQELLLPAVYGTTRILESVHRHAPQVQRVVITSSFAAIMDITKGRWPEHTYTQADWCPFTYDDGKSGPASVAYVAYKKLAEQVAFQYVEEHMPNFTISTICPPLVYGPVANTVQTMEKLNTSSKDIYRLITGNDSTVPENALWDFVDVRNVAIAHVRAYETASAGGQRNFVELWDKTPEGIPGEPLPPVYKGHLQGAKGLGLDVPWSRGDHHRYCEELNGA